MRKIANEVMVKKIETKYEAVDGTMFNTEDECKKWEESYQCTIRNSFKKIPQIRIDGARCYTESASEDDEVFALLPRDFEDIKIINAYVSATIGGATSGFTQEDIDKVLILNFGYDHDWCNWCRMDIHLNQIQKDYADYTAKLNDVLNKKQDEQNENKQTV